MLGGYWISRLGVLAGDAGMATPQHTPRGRGFDSSLIYYHHANDYWTRQEGGCTANTSDPERPTRHVPCVDLWQDDGPAQAANASAGATYEEYLFKEQALRVLDAHDPAQPLFLYYAAHIAHQPYEVPASYNSSFAFIPDPQRQLYHAMVACLDDVLKELVAGFQAKGLWDDTLMVMSTVRARPLWLFDPIVCSQGGAAFRTMVDRSLPARTTCHFAAASTRTSKEVSEARHSSLGATCPPRCEGRRSQTRCTYAIGVSRLSGQFLWHRGELSFAHRCRHDVRGAGACGPNGPRS